MDSEAIKNDAKIILEKVFKLAEDNAIVIFFDFSKGK